MHGMICSKPQIGICATYSCTVWEKSSKVCVWSHFILTQTHSCCLEKKSVVAERILCLCLYFKVLVGKFEPHWNCTISLSSSHGLKEFVSSPLKFRGKFTREKKKKKTCWCQWKTEHILLLCMDTARQERQNKNKERTLTSRMNTHSNDAAICGSKKGSRIHFSV